MFCMCQPGAKAGKVKKSRSSRRTVENAEEEADRSGAPPACMSGAGWHARGDKLPEEKRVPFNRPSARQVYDALPFVRRYFMYWVRHTGKKEKLFINTFQPLQHKPYYGERRVVWSVPCGGIGSGSIGRDFRGGFCKFGLRPGLIEHKVNVVPSDQFILSVRRPGDADACYQKVLCAADIDRSAGQLSAWDFDFPETDIAFRGLYPRSWTCYYIAELSLVVVLRQISPVIPHNYKDSSLPATVFVVDVENRSAEDYEVSIAFTFRNGTGYYRWEADPGCSSKEFQYNRDEQGPGVHGITLEHNIDRMRCTYALGLKTSENPLYHASICRSFQPSANGQGVWKHLRETGDLPDHGRADEASVTEQAVGICVRTTVAAGERRESAAEMALVWHMPVVKFGNGERTYKRRYTRYFDEREEGARALCTYALRERQRWEEEIEQWQRPVLEHEHLPLWYKSALFNELYFITDGGSIWFEWDEEWTKREPHLSEYARNVMREHGRFGYLESWEYRMVNTYDVHFYASFALAHLWPQLEISVQAEFTDQVEHVDEVVVRFHMEGDRAPQKTRTRVPHDLGNPAADPWLLTNAYVMHDTGKWKDLNLKFVLTSWRDYVCIVKRERAFLEHVYPAVKSLISQGLTTWDTDGDGMIENFGKADQTYDAWQMEGVSAYCGSLWLAALRVAVELAREIGDDEKANEWNETLQRAKKVFVEKLWTGEYFRFCERSRSRDSVMADQLCGIWFLQSVSPEMAEELLPLGHVQSALTKIFELNVQRFAGGRMGAVNGMRPDGKVDRAYIQADEMWTGVTYAVAAFMIQQGDYQRAFDTAWGTYDACFNRFGLQYQTPEALYEKKFYRAIGYMRPLAVWAMQWALEKHAGLGGANEKRGISELRETTFATCSKTSVAAKSETTVESSTVVTAQPSPAATRSDDDGGSEGYGSDEKESSATVGHVLPPAMKSTTTLTTLGGAASDDAASSSGVSSGRDVVVEGL
ncbi:hpo-13 [Pristionchus pacificus]|uniref:Hpo-13 n=1 Tax=Pristionchus pacificus TaxID=54126 RepID=A0A2A6BST2_PRIPA|nr:hpo-13 [Pristionchus pacificus]|eukprot:PDM68948.1 hpo-13 [Pristionchus pacificus]